MSDPPAAEIGVFGGSGFYEFLTDTESVQVDTPYGPPAAAPTIGTVAGRRVAFLPRHGERHQFPPDRRALPGQRLGDEGARRAAASSRPVRPARSSPTSTRASSSCSTSSSTARGAAPTPTTTARPCTTRPSPIRTTTASAQALLAAGRAAGITVHDGGTVVVIQGPRFSTRAESRWFRQMGWHVVNMTNYPEAVLAKEAGLAYGAVALITDYDAGVDGQEPVTMDAVLARMAENVSRVRDLIERAVPLLP